MKKKRFNYYRLILQSTILLLLVYMVVRAFTDTQYSPDYEAYCPFGGLQALSGYFVTTTLACSMTSTQIAMGLALIIAIIIFSKLFCSYVCPIGTLTEWIGKLGEKLKVRFTITGFADRILRIFKYVLLFLTFYLTISSGELFCRKFDPYYAGFTGFSGDTVVLYAVLTLVIVVLGSFFIRQAWCKYLCPLGAATNIFANFIPFAALVGIYLFLYFAFNVHLSWIWLLGSITFIIMLEEVFLLKVKIFPLLKITRNPDTCTLCKKCDKVCPMAIKVSELGKVEHIDCHMCGDCIVACPEKDVLRINRRNIRWVLPIAVVVLIVAALIFSSYNEVPTISERWGTVQQLANAKVYEQSGLKNIKCFGTSTAFAEQMKKVKGIVGVETFVGSHTVKIYYDPAIITEQAVKEAIFTPSAIMLHEPDVKKIGVMEIRVRNYFDAFDEYYMTELLSSDSAIFGFTSAFAEPIHLKIYFNPDSLQPSEIIALIESEEINIAEGKNITVQKLNFEVQDEVVRPSYVSLQDFYAIMAPPMDDKFNKFKSYKTSDLSVYEIAITPFNNETSDQLTYLESHLSNDDGVVGFKTIYQRDSVFADITFVTTKTTPTKIFKLMQAEKLKVYYNDSTSDEMDNTFKFEKEGKVLIRSKAQIP